MEKLGSAGEHVLEERTFIDNCGSVLEDIFGNEDLFGEFCVFLSSSCRESAAVLQKQGSNKGPIVRWYRKLRKKGTVTKVYFLPKNAGLGTICFMHFL